MILARDGLRELILSSLTLGSGGGLAAWAAITGSPWWWLAAGPLLALWLFTLAFFRDPDRTIPTEPGRLVSPADGTVTEVTRLPESEGFEGPAVRIGIFLSLFNVHINRSPCAGRVIRTDYRPGEFLDARHPESGVRNEAMTIRIEPDADVPGPIIVRQVAGLVARRIVCRVAAGDRVTRGGRFGLIKFGSRTELILPDRPEVRAVVRVGDRVRGGSSVLVHVERNCSHQADDDVNTAAADDDISTAAAN
ncbi:MAG: phosphatidylserine decarboxylase [Phycisphaerae bacterium]